MRQVLFRIPWEGIPIAGGTLPLFGLGILLAIWTVLVGWTIYAAYLPRKGKLAEKLDPFTIGFWLLLGFAILRAPVFGPPLAPQGIPVFGYGVMLLCGIVSAVWLAERRARRANLPPESIWDLAFWIILPGIVGARLFYLMQYHQRVYAEAKTVPQYLLATINLAEGGIVLYGGVIAGAIAYFTFCAVRKLPPLTVADVITPSVFVGIGFGRIGCLLNGCCFGDACTLPWGLEFPPESGPYVTLVMRGFLEPDAPSTPPLHPTQIYSAIDGFLIAALTLWYSPYRRVPGDVLCLGVMLSSITRFLIEFIRGDEFGQFGTTLTISQWISLALFGLGLAFQVYLTWRSTESSASIADQVSTTSSHTPARAV